MNKLLWLLERPFIIWLLRYPLSPLLSLILKFWELNDELPTSDTSVQFIFLISYAATPEGLTNGSLHTTRLVPELAKRYPCATIIGGEFSNNPANTYEWDKKLAVLHRQGLNVDRAHNVGRVSSSIDEIFAMIRAADRFIQLQNINNCIVVAEGAHSRRARVVWRHYLPHTKIHFRSISAKHAADPKNPMAAQRYWQVWLVANLIAFPLFKWFPGVERIARKNPSQPVSFHSA
ncbi:MAG: hypothetical protein K0S38_512 [Candidatus Paceibacter sp.]|jgi:hypothetical protein|nr:hypothetical protein [Candidatus Paceibacter sp.]